MLDGATWGLLGISVSIIIIGSVLSDTSNNSRSHTDTAFTSPFLMPGSPCVSLAPQIPRMLLAFDFLNALVSASSEYSSLRFITDDEPLEVSAKHVLLVPLLGSVTLVVLFFWFDAIQVCFKLW